MSGSYSIVEFEDGNQLIPTSWLHDSNKRCFWPKLTNPLKINQCIEKQAPVDLNTWTSIPVIRIFGSSNQYESGIQKLKLSMQMSDIDTTASEGEGERKRRKIIPASLSSESESEDIECNQPVLSTKLPELPQPPIYKNNNLKDNETITEILSMDIENPAINNHMNEKKLHLWIIQKLNKLQKSVDNLEKGMINLYKRFNHEPLNSSNSEVMNQFPITDEEGMKKLEESLESDSNKRLMALALKGIGGTDDDSLIFNILRRCISNSIAEMYSFLGTKQKKNFKILNFTKVILEAVRCHNPNITEAKFASVTACWLRHAKQRRERHEKKVQKDSSCILPC